MVILKIKQNKKKPKFALVVLDDGEKYNIYKFVVNKYGLRKGDELNPKKLQELLYWDEFYRAKDVALKYFDYRHRSEYEIIRKLEVSKFNSNIIEKVIANLKSIGLLNDYEFAENYAKSLLNKRLISRNLMKHKLLEKKVPDEIINDVINKYYKDSDEYSIAKKVATKQLKKYQKLKPKSTSREHFIRLTSFLVRRGFNREVISKVVKEILKIDREYEE